MPAMPPPHWRTDGCLILTHTHAACSVFDNRTRGVGSRVEIKTIDSLIGQIAGAYHVGLGLPKDVATWARQTEDGYDFLAVKAAALLKRYPAIARSLASRYPVIICDEHQDSTGERHAAIMSLHEQGVKAAGLRRPHANRLHRQGPYRRLPAPRLGGIYRSRRRHSSSWTPRTVGPTDVQTSERGF